MKVTTLIPDALVHEVRRFTKKKTLTESLLIALREWISSKKLSQLNKRIKKKPLEFREGYSAESVRRLNRQS